MTLFEWAVTYWVPLGQLLLIGWGIWEMRKNNYAREASSGLMIEQSKVLARVLERTA